MRQRTQERDKTVTRVDDESGGDTITPCKYPEETLLLPPTPSNPNNPLRTSETENKLLAQEYNPNPALSPLSPAMIEDREAEKQQLPQQMPPEPLLLHLQHFASLPPRSKSNLSSLPN